MVNLASMIDPHPGDAVAEAVKAFVVPELRIARPPGGARRPSL